MRSARVVLLLVAVLTAAGLLLQAEEAAPGDAVPEAARKACFDGKWLLVQNRLDEAIDRLSLALDLWPGYPEAQELLTQARAKRAEAQTLHDQAVALLKENKWDEAIQQAGAALRVFPAYPEAKALMAETRRQAAEAHLASGHARLADGDRKGAEEAFRLALAYVPDLEAANEGLARVAMLRAEDAAGRGLWGSVLVWATEAAARAPKREDCAEQVRAARVRVLEQIRFTVGPEADSGAVPSADTVALRAATLRQLEAKKPPGLSILGPGASARPDFTIGITARPVEVKGGRQRVENRVHTYIGRREEPNPEYQRVRDVLDSAVATLGRMRLDYDRPCPVCAGSRWLLCRTCGGTGTRGGAPCPRCTVPGGRPGWIRCPRCGGTGHWSGLSELDLRRQELEVSRLQMQLARTPAMVVRQYNAEWPYTLEFYEKTADAEGGLRVTRTATGEIVATDALRRRGRYEDTAVQDPNPQVGLAADPLVLPDDDAIRRTLLDELAEAAAAKVLAAIVTAQAAALQVNSLRLFTEGKVAEAAETGVQAAVLMESVSRDEADLQMRRLRDRLRIEERSPEQPPPSVVPPPPSPPAGPEAVSDKPVRLRAAAFAPGGVALHRRFRDESPASGFWPEANSLALGPATGLSDKA